MTEQEMIGKECFNVNYSVCFAQSAALQLRGCAAALLLLLAAAALLLRCCCCCAAACCCWLLRCC